MTERQRIALAYPCHRAYETTAPHFKRVIGNLSTILSINK